MSTGDNVSRGHKDTRTCGERLLFDVSGLRERGVCFHDGNDRAERNALVSGGIFRNGEDLDCGGAADDGTGVVEGVRRGGFDGEGRAAQSEAHGHDVG